MKPKPRLFWRYYPKSKRGFWCVSKKPKWYYQAEWRKAYIIVSAMNEAVARSLDYRREYRQQLEQRKTT